MEIVKSGNDVFALEHNTSSPSIFFLVTQLISEDCYILPQKPLVAGVLFHAQPMGEEPILDDYLVPCAGKKWDKFDGLPRYQREYVATQYVKAYINYVKLALVDSGKGDWGWYGDYKVWRTQLKNPDSVVVSIKESDHNELTIDFLLRNKIDIESSVDKMAVEMSRNVSNMMKEIQYDRGPF